MAGVDTLMGQTLPTIIGGGVLVSVADKAFSRNSRKSGSNRKSTSKKKTIPKRRSGSRKRR